MYDITSHLLLMLPSPAASLLAMTTVPIDAFYQNFVTVLDGAYGEIYPPLLYLWRFFIVISISWMGLQWALTENPVAAQGLRRMIFLSAILFVAHEWVPLTEALADGFGQLGALAAGDDSLPVTTSRNPSSFGTHSFTTAFIVIDKATALASGWRSTLSNLPVIILLLLAGLGIFACGAIIVLLMLVYLLLFKIGCIVVFCLLPFGAFDKTAWIVERPIGWVMSNGIRFLVLTLIVGLLYRFAADATSQALHTEDGTWTDLGNATAVSLQLLLVNLLLLVFVFMANRFAGEIAGGAASLGLSDFSNRTAATGTAEPAVRGAASAVTGTAHYAAGAAVLGVVAAGASAAAMGTVWSKAKQKVSFGSDESNAGSTAGSTGPSSPRGSPGSATATATQPITSLFRTTPTPTTSTIPVPVQRVPHHDAGSFGSSSGFGGSGIRVEVLRTQSPRPSHGSPSELPPALPPASNRWSLPS